MNNNSENFWRWGKISARGLRLPSFPLGSGLVVADQGFGSSCKFAESESE